MPLSVGSCVGPYEIVAPLGAGGMGEVYRARDPRLGRDVALKVLPDHFSSDPERVARFRREAQVLASLHSPNIAIIHGVEEMPAAAGAQPLTALVLELVEGPTLADRIAEGPLDPPEALGIARQIADALEAAHDQGIVHRDLKPANIKVRPDGTVKVLDFGLATIAAAAGAVSGSTNPSLLANSPTLASPSLMTGIGVLLGTAPYMSPEQAKGHPADKRSDIWAFGCVLYEMLTGRRAFEGDDITDTLANILKTEPYWSRLPSTIAPQIRQVLKCTLDKNRRTRIPDISAVRFLLDQEPIAVAQPPAALPAADRGRRRILRAAFITVGLLVALALGALIDRFSSPLPPVPVVARLPLTLPDNVSLGGGSVLPVVALSQDGSKLAFVAAGVLYVRSLDEPTLRRMVSVDTSVQALASPVFSPDGQSIAYLDGLLPREGTLKFVPIEGGAPVKVTQVSFPFGLTWSSRGILIAEKERGISLITPQGGNRDPLVNLKPGEVAQRPSLLPDGDTILFTVTSNVTADAASPSFDDWRRGQVVAQSISTGKRTTLVERGVDARYVPTGHLLYASEGVLHAVPFDADRLVVRGRPVPVVDGVQRHGGPPSTGSAHVAISDTGTLAYVKGPVTLDVSLQRLVVVDRAGRIEEVKLQAAAYVGPRLSPDHKRITFGIDSGKQAEVFIYDLSGVTAPRQLTFGGQNRFPLWSQDGARIAFQSALDKDGGIFWQRADGATAPERLTTAEAGTSHVPEAFSPDGKFLLFLNIKGTSHTLWTLTLADKTTARFSNVESLAATAAAFSPDGRWVAYGQRDAATANIALWVEPFPATRAKYLITSNGFRPLWSPDGKELVFGTRGQSWVVTIEAKPEFAFGNPVPLGFKRFPPPGLGEREYDVFPDGQRFIFSLPAESPLAGVREIQVVVNWFEELKRKVPLQ